MSVIVFRVDASLGIGTGHVMRCLALAAALSAKGATCRFVCRDHEGHLAEHIRSCGYSVALLQTITPSSEESGAADLPAHAAWLRVSWQEDARQTMAALDGPPDWLVVDHYALDYRWEEALRPQCHKVMVIDDLADRRHHCDLLLDQNFRVETGRYDGLLPPEGRQLLGPEYALLRSAFARQSGVVPVRAGGKAPRLLVMFGGADRSRQTERVVRLLLQMGWAGPVDVVAGPLYAAVEELEQCVEALPQGTLHRSPSNIQDLMRAADLALGAPGVTSLERCACALPAITVAQALNQEAVGQALAEAGAHVYLGSEQDVSDEDWKQALTVLAKHVGLLRGVGEKAAALCDGRGASRVAMVLLQVAVTVRKATLEDGPMLFAWRNDIRTRRLSLDASPLVLENHLQWVERTLRNADVDLLLCRAGDRDTACIRFDHHGAEAVVSIYVDPDLQGQGAGGSALRAALAWLRQVRPGTRMIRARVLEANIPSQRMFSACGFMPAETCYTLTLTV